MSPASPRRCSRLLLVLALAVTSPVSSAAEAVIVLHGLARSERAMRPLAGHLEAAGFAVTNLDYSSTTATVEELVEAHLLPPVQAQAEAERLHFVTHSMGGILVRQLIATQRPPNLGRVVMIAPPNRGSELVDKLGGLPPFRWINGPAGSQLGTGDASLPLRLGAADFPLGVIAGRRSFNPLYSWLIPGDDDGKVAVERAKLEGMTDFIVIDRSHTFIQNGPDTADQAVQFLRNGAFHR